MKRWLALQESSRLEVSFGLSQALQSHLGTPAGDVPIGHHKDLDPRQFGQEHNTSSWRFAFDPLTGG